jgi:hypothetical protein
MDALTVDDLLHRRSWLTRAEADLSERLQRRFPTREGVRHPNDPLYQRMWYALKRLRSELSRLDAAIAQRGDRAA